MFILVPTGHGQGVVRRWPWVTTVIVALNVLVYVALLPGEISNAKATEQSLQAMVEYLDQHPYLTPPTALESILSNKDRKTLAKAKSNEARLGIVGEATILVEQATLDELAERLHQIAVQSISYQFGYRPADNNWLALLTSQFLHAGVFHLLGNMWFLWLVGCNVEDGWGRLVFPAFYLSAGVIAALTHKLGDPTSALPLVGASGAIAGAMGAFLIRHATTKIKFFALLLWKPMRFAAPAYLMLPLWFVVQVLSGFYQGQGPGVAYFAHIGGFAYGVLVAVLFRISGFEKQLSDKIDDRGAFIQDPLVAEAAQHTDQGRYGAAMTKLEGLLEQQPRHVDALLELLRASVAAGDTGRECRAKIKLIEIYLQTGAPESALSLYGELGAAGQRYSVPPSLRMRVGRHYERMGSTREAWTTFQELHDQTDDRSIALTALIAHAELATKLGRKADALLLWQRARAHGSTEVTGIVNDGLARAAALD